MFKEIADKEEVLWSWLIERWAEKEPKSFWEDDGPKPKRWEGILVKHWPQKITFGYWYYLFEGLDRNDYGWSPRYGNHLPWVNLWDFRGKFREEFWYWLTNGGLRWTRLWEETRPERLICRWKGHPEGEVYWNPGGASRITIVRLAEKT